MTRADLAGEYLAMGYWQGTTVAQALGRAVRDHPRQVALVHGRQRVTYEQVGRRVERLARAFHDSGLGAGDVVTVQLPNWPEYVYVHFALARIGAVTLPASPLLRGREMSHILGFSRSQGYVLPVTFGGFDYLQMLREVRPSSSDLRQVWVAGDTAPPGTRSLRAMLAAGRPGPPLPDGLHQHGRSVCQALTGGTTGLPKGVPRSHDQLLCHACNWAQVIEAGPQSVFLVPVPLSHVYGLVEGLYIPVLAGARLVLLDRFEPGAALRAIQEEGVTHALLVPALLASLLRSPHLGRQDISSLRVIITGGGPCPEELVRLARARLGCQVISQYGMSEGVLSTTALEDPPEVVSFSVGTPHCQGSEFKVVGEGRKSLPPGETGELAFRGPTLFDGYFRDSAATAAAFDQEGWFYTGDLGFQDGEGNLHIVGRRKDLIRRGGETVMPREVEELLETHPKVLEAVAIGMPDGSLGERVCVYVVPQGGETITLPEVVRFLKQKGLAAFKLPERLEVVAGLPLTSSSKVRKDLLREDIARKLRGEKRIGTRRLATSRNYREVV